MQGGVPFIDNILSVFFKKCDEFSLGLTNILEVAVLAGDKIYTIIAWQSVWRELFFGISGG